MSKSLGLGLASAALLAGCGGGGGDGGEGGGTLYVTFKYPNVDVQLYHQVTVQPQTTGFDGRTPHCTLVQGSLPAGLQLHSDCTIAGRVMQAASPMFVVRVGASGVSNTVDITTGLSVVGPGLMYPFRTPMQPVPIGVFVDDALSVPGWTAPPDLVGSWTYRLDSGSLPTGLSLDPHSGRISGTAQARGAFSAGIVGTLTSQFGNHDTPSINYAVNVNVPPIGYAGSTSLGSPLVAYLSQAFSGMPEPVGVALPGVTFSGATFLSPLPAGLSSNGAGEISGVATGTETPARAYDVRATLHNAGASETTQGLLYLAVRSPVRYIYGSGYVHVRNLQPLDVRPIEIAVSAIPLQAGATRLFLPRPGQCTLPPGSSLDPATGVLTGTPMSNGNYSCQLDVEISNNGVTWTLSTELAVAVQ